MIARNPALSPDQPYAVIRELEPNGLGRVVDVLTVFLTASECPIGCAMCDLWQNTTTTPTRSGAIVRQIEFAIADQDPAGWIKLYNSGNFFDPHSIPPNDYPAIAKSIRGFDRIIVENHPKFGKERLKTFRDLLAGPLEVAVGLETVQPRWLGRLAKQMTRDDFDTYASWLAAEKVSLRVFLIVGVPGIGNTEAIRWARLSVRHAIRCGARHVSLIPARAGHGWNGLAADLPHLETKQLANLLSASVADADGAACVTMDLWDADQSDESVIEMHRVNREQRVVSQ